MFKTDRTVFRCKEGILDLMDEKNMNITSGSIPYKNKTEKKQRWKELKQEFGENINIIFRDHFIHYSAQVDRTHF